MKKGRGSANDRACQLCFQEPRAVSIDLHRIGERCLKILTAIARDAGIDLEVRNGKVFSRAIGEPTSRVG